MNPDVQRNLSDSAGDFLRVVWPRVSRFCGGGALTPTEAVTSTWMNRQLDTLGGIDAWQLLDDRHTMRGIASRVQWIKPGDPVWESFTIRATTRNGGPTEWQKRCAAISDNTRGWLIPHLTIQAYISTPRGAGSLLSAAVIRTTDLYEYAMPLWDRARSKPNPADGNRFKIFFWRDIERAGCRIRIARSGGEE